MNRVLAATTLAIALGATGAAAQDAVEVADPGIVSEVKVGVMQHDIDFLPHSVEDGQAVNAEILFEKPFFPDRWWSPRPHLGTTVALEGETDHIYAGVTWTVRPFHGSRFAPLWLSAFGGGAVHDGEIDDAGPDEKALGSRALFRFGFEAGWDVTEDFSVSAYYAHISNAFIAEPNPGIEHAGVRVGWRF